MGERYVEFDELKTTENNGVKTTVKQRGQVFILDSFSAQCEE
jgi:hypothetical protein